jgi:hypothetical protein
MISIELKVEGLRELHAGLEELAGGGLGAPIASLSSLPIRFSTCVTVTSARTSR